MCVKEDATFLRAIGSSRLGGFTRRTISSRRSPAPEACASAIENTVHIQNGSVTVMVGPEGVTIVQLGQTLVVRNAM